MMCHDFHGCSSAGYSISQLVGFGAKLVLYACMKASAVPWESTLDMLLRVYEDQGTRKLSVTKKNTDRQNLRACAIFFSAVFFVALALQRIPVFNLFIVNSLRCMLSNKAGEPALKRATVPFGLVPK